MAACGEVVCSEVARKVEAEVCGSGVNAVGVVATVDCNVGGNGNGGLTGVLVNGRVEVSAGKTGGSESVDVDDDGEVDQFKKEGLGVEKEGTPVDLTLVLVTNGIGQDVDGPVEKVSGEREAEVESGEEVDGANMDDAGFGLAESGLNTVESSQVTVSEFSVKPADVTVTDSLFMPDVINGPESVINLVDKVECQVTVDVSGKPYEDLGSQVVDVEPGSCEGPIKEPECEVSVDGSDSVGGLVDNQECQVSVDESAPSAKHTEKEENATVVLPEEVEALANGEVEKFDRILENGETRISGTEADECSEKLLKVAESVKMVVNTEEMKEQVKVEDEIQESQKVSVENVQDDELNLEDNSAESADAAEVSLEAEGSQLEASAENFETFDVSYDDDDDEKETEVKDADDEGRVENVVVSDDEEKESEVKDADVEAVDHIIQENGSAEDTGCETGIKTVDFPDEEKESEVNDASVGDQPTLSFSNTIVNHQAVIKFGSFGLQNEEVKAKNSVQTDEIPNSSVEGEVNAAIDVQNEEVEVLEYNFLVRISRFEDEDFRDQIKKAHEVVEEKTGLRDILRAKILEKRDMMKALNEEYDLVRKDEMAARRVVKAKRQEIEAVQAIISRWKNAMTVQDIDSKIFGVEYMIQHETIRLIDEKEFIRELKKLKTLRDQLASGMGTPEEIRHAIDTKDQNEETMKTLRKELEALKREVTKIEDVLRTIAVKYGATSNQERELGRQFRTADGVRQKAYAELNDLKKLSFDKNTNFRQFKEDFTSATNFLSQGNKDALHRLCANQVETFMEQWNNNAEFRQEYVSRITSRKQKASDGAPLVPDDMASALPTNVNGKVDKSPVSVPNEVKHVSVVTPVAQGKNASSDNHTSKYIEKVSGQRNQDLKNKGVAKPTDLGNGDVAKESRLAVVAEVAENVLTKEEIELAKKAEELRNEEIAAKLKEQRRVEEKAKAVEALERKKRNAEKAQVRAELRARKEAEQKEKGREKRLRKKEKKTGDGCINGEEAAGSEGSNEAATKELETVTNKKKSQKPPAHFFSKQLKPKSAPSPLINKSKKRWQQFKRVVFIVLAVIGLAFVFLLANFGLFLDFKSSKLTGAF